jgi:hypothetical protein
MTVATYSDTILLPVSEIATYAKPLPAEYYIRGSRDSIDSETVNKLKEQLVTRPADGSLPIVQVNDAFTFVDIDGQYYWLNGNTRSRALIEMQNETKYNGCQFADVPVREYTGDKSIGAIRRFQVQSNDSTSAHTTNQLITAIQLDYDFYVSEAPEDFSATKKSAYANAKLVESYGLSEVRIGQYRKIAKAPLWFQEQINAGVIAVDVAIDMLRAEEKTEVPLQTIFFGCRSLLSEKEAKITGKHFKAFSKVHLKTSENNSEGAVIETSEAGEDVAETPTKAAKVVDSEKATNDILSVMTIFGTVVSTEIETAKISDTVVATVGAAANVIGLLLGKQWIQPAKAINAFDTIQDLLFGLLTNDEGEIALPESLTPEELGTLLKQMQPLGKQLDLLTSVSDSDEASEDDSDDFEDENEEYTIATV